MYYTNASDGYLYSVEKADLDNASVGSFLSNIAKRIDAISCGKGRKFSSFGNGLGINEFANTLYLKFENERTISIVDINDKENCHITNTFEGGFDVYSITGDKDNKVTHVLRQVSTVSLAGKTTTQLYACTYKPAQFQQKALIETMLVLFLALAIVMLLLAIWFFIATKNDRTLYKVKSIRRDFKKNKWIYLSLVFFIVLLIMFCYYEAIGAISMSFFDYTREKPAWIWNNFGNYLRIFNQHDFWLSIKNMLFFLVSDLILGIIPPLIFAFLLVIIRNKTVSNWIRSMMFIPGIIPGMAAMLIWREGIYGTDGAFNQLIGLFGHEPIAWLDNIDYARWSLIFMGFPFVGGYLIFYGGMMNIPAEYHEAGRLEGLGIVKQFLLIDIPLISPQIKYIFITTFIASVQNYARTYILGSSGTVTPVENMYRIMTGTQADYGMASAYATILFVFLFAAVATNFKMQRKDTMGEDL
jgi:ABC-type sugar transport system permease subunit